MTRLTGGPVCAGMRRAWAAGRLVGAWGLPAAAILHRRLVRTRLSRRLITSRSRRLIASKAHDVHGRAGHPRHGPTRRGAGAGPRVLETGQNAHAARACTDGWGRPGPRLHSGPDPGRCMHLSGGALHAAGLCANMPRICSTAVDSEHAPRLLIPNLLRAYSAVHAHDVAHERGAQDLAVPPPPFRLLLRVLSGARRRDTSLAFREARLPRVPSTLRHPQPQPSGGPAI